MAPSGLPIERPIQASSGTAGFFKPVVNIDFNFGSTKSISSVSIGRTQDNLADVVLPSYNISSSNDGIAYMFAQALIVRPSSANDNSPYSTDPHGFFTLSGPGIDAQYVRVEAGQW